MKLLVEHPRFEQLVEAIKGARDVYARNLANNISLNGGPHVEPVNQRYVDYQRGFWNGAIFAVTRFPKQKAKDWDKFVAEAMKEADEQS